MSKTMSLAAMHLTVAFTVPCLMSGKPLVGGAIAVVEPLTNTVACHSREQVWNRVRNAGCKAPNRLVSMA